MDVKLNAPKVEVEGPKVDIGAKVGGFVGDLFGGKKHKAKVDLPDASLEIRAPNADVQLAAPNVNIGAGAQVAAPQMVLKWIILFNNFLFDAIKLVFCRAAICRSAAQT